MKRLLLFTFGIILLYNPTAYSALPLSCQTASECFNSFQCQNATGGGCCETGTTGTAYDCPLGWFYNSSQGLCIRSSTSSSDSKGYTLTNYGTCAATTSTYPCYSYKTSTGGVYDCLRCGNGLIKPEA